jgi:hypothetical protein
VPVPDDELVAAFHVQVVLRQQFHDGVYMRLIFSHPLSLVWCCTSATQGTAGLSGILSIKHKAAEKSCKKGNS